MEDHRKHRAVEGCGNYVLSIGKQREKLQRSAIGPHIHMVHGILLLISNGDDLQFPLRGKGTDRVIKPFIFVESIDQKILSVGLAQFAGDTALPLLSAQEQGGIKDAFRFKTSGYQCIPESLFPDRDGGKAFYVFFVDLPALQLKILFAAAGN